MAEATQDDEAALSRIDSSQQRHWFGIAVQRFGQVSALSQFLIGATLGYGMSFGKAALAILLGSVILQVIMCIVGIIGQKQGLNTTLLSRWTGFGEIGAALVGLALGVSLIGWFGVQSGISAQSLDQLVPNVMPVWVWSLLFGLVVTAIVAFGIGGMQWLANITVPLFLILVIWSVVSELSKHSFMHLITSPAPGPELSLWAGTGLVAGGMIAGAIITADMTRFNRTGRDVVKQTVLGVSLGEFGIGLAGVLLAHAAKSDNIVAIVTSSVGFVGLIIVITGTLKINDWNLYSSSLGLVNFVATVFRTRLNTTVFTIILGVIGSVLAAVGILDKFQTFLTILGVAFPPIAGIMVAEYYIVKKWRPALDESKDSGGLPAVAPRIVPMTLIIWAVSSVVGYFVTWGIPAVWSLLLSMVLYIVAGKLGLVRGIGTSHTPAEGAAA